MKKSIFSCLLLLFAGTVACLAQPKQITLTGIISMNTGETFPYKIVFTETEGKIKGYSLTFKEPDQTKAAITGIMDRRMHTLDFKETEILSSQGVRTKAYMCLVDAQLQYNANGRGNILTGPINSTEADKKTSCTAGSLLFTNEEEIQNLFAYHEKFDTVISMKKKPKDAYIPPPTPKQEVQEAPLVTDKITAGIEKAYDWNTDTAIVDIWDGGNTDGDRVTVSLNGKPWLTNYFLVKERRQLRLPLADGINTISFLAVNEGSDPPNTASVLLTDGTTHYSVLAYNTKGQQAIIKIKKRKL